MLTGRAPRAAFDNLTQRSFIRLYSRNTYHCSTFGFLPGGVYCPMNRYTFSKGKLTINRQPDLSAGDKRFVYQPSLVVVDLACWEHAALPPNQTGKKHNEPQTQPS